MQHLHRCTAEHWMVVHPLVFVRSQRSTQSRQLAVLQKENVVCSGIGPDDVTSGKDSKWVRCTKSSILWSHANSTAPFHIFEDRLNGGDPLVEGFILKDHEQHGTLLRRVPNYATSQSVQKGSRSSGPATPTSSPLSASQQSSKLSSQTVSGAPLGQTHSAHPNRNDDKDFQHDSGNFSNSAAACGLNEEEVKSIASKQQQRAIKRVFIHRMLEGCGEPWVVEHAQVVVRRGPSTREAAIGVVLNGDIVGVLRRKGNWVQLEQDSDVRTSKDDAAVARIQGVNMIRAIEVREYESGQGAHSNEVDFPEVPGPEAQRPTEAWMMIDHPTYGQLIRKCEDRKAVLEGCVVGKERGDLYRQVIDLCYQRIYEENLDSLWGGDRHRLPTKESMEAKLFETGTLLVHTSVDGKLAGGAIVKRVSVRSREAVSPYDVKDNDEDRLGHTTLGYIDSCATTRGMGAGTRIWDFVAGLRFAFVTCHTILRPDTVDFWKARGMIRMDPTRENDCQLFRRTVLLRSGGSIVCNLPDVAAALPASRLPLFVWLPTGADALPPWPDYLFSVESPTPE